MPRDRDDRPQRARPVRADDGPPGPRRRPGFAAWLARRWVLVLALACVATVAGIGSVALAVRWVTAKGPPRGVDHNEVAKWSYPEFFDHLRSQGFDCEHAEVTEPDGVRAAVGRVGQSVFRVRDYDTFEAAQTFAAPEGGYAWNRFAITGDRELIIRIGRLLNR